MYIMLKIKDLNYFDNFSLLYLLANLPIIPVILFYNGEISMFARLVIFITQLVVTFLIVKIVLKMRPNDKNRDKLLNLVLIAIILYLPVALVFALQTIEGDNLKTIAVFYLICFLNLAKFSFMGKKGFKETNANYITNPLYHYLPINIHRRRR